VQAFDTIISQQLNTVEPGRCVVSIEKRNVGDVTVLDVTGKLKIGEADVELRNAVHEALGAGHRKILLNLRKVSAMDSSGVGELMAARTSILNAGGQLRLAELSPRVSTVLQVTNLAGLLEPNATEEEALGSFA